MTEGDGRESDTQHNNDYLYSDAPAPGSPNASNVRAYTRQYQYDKIGNVQQVKQLGTNGFTRNFVYNTGVNTLQKIEDGSSVNIQSFTYDDVGNQITAGTTRSYVWNAANELITYYNQAGSSDPSIFAQYNYSGGNRVSKMVRTGSAGSPIYERVIYIDGVFEYHILENGSTYEKNYVHIMDDKSRIAMVRIGDQFPDDITNAITYTLEDQIGSSTVRLNTTGGVIDKEEYYPFGDSSLRTFSKKRYRYVGKEKDLESGLYYYGARYYAAWTCRFISIDPLAADYPFYTPYNYAGNKPIHKIDIDGMQEEGNNGNKNNSNEDSPSNNNTSESDVTNGVNEENSVGIPTTFYDEDGLETDEIPEVVQKMFQEEYGITVGYENGKLFKKGDYETNLKVSQDAKSEWENALTSENTERSLVFGYNLALGADPTIGKKTLKDPVVRGTYNPNNKTAYIDLADFDKKGNVLGSHAISTSEESFNMRSYNLARAMEHEFLGHGSGRTDEGHNSLGEVEYLLNHYRDQMGIPKLDSYQYSTDEFKPNSKNPEKSVRIVSYSFDGGKHSLFFNRNLQIKMNKYVR